MLDDSHSEINPIRPATHSGLLFAPHFVSHRFLYGLNASALQIILIKNLKF
jgi:hypothetical protein